MIDKERRFKIILYCLLLVCVYLNRFNALFRYLIFFILIFPLFLSSTQKTGTGNLKKGLLVGCGASLIYIPFIYNKVLIADVLQIPYVVAEEVFFRGYLMGAPDRRNVHIVNLVVSAMFALPHLIKECSMVSVLTFFPSIVFGYLYYYSDSLLAPVLFHWTSNLFFVHNRDIFSVILG